MEDLKSWGLLLLFVSAGSLIYCFLLPSGSVSKMAKSVISIAFVCVAFMPLTSLAQLITDTDFSFSEVLPSEDFRPYVEQSARQETEKIISGCVRKYTSVPYETEIFINIGEDLGIRIEYIRLVFSAKPQFEDDIVQAIYSQLGIIPDVRVEMASG